MNSRVKDGKKTVVLRRVTTKKVARKLRANSCSSGGSFRLAPALTGMSLPWYSWKSSGESSEHYARGLVIDGEDSRDRSPRLATSICDNHDPDLAYVSNAAIAFDADEDYEEDTDNDLEQSDDVLSSSLVAEPSPYLDAVIHNHDLYSIVRPRDQS